MRKLDLRGWGACRPRFGSRQRAADRCAQRDGDQQRRSSTSAGLPSSTTWEVAGRRVEKNLQWGIEDPRAPLLSSSLRRRKVKSDRILMRMIRRKEGVGRRHEKRGITMNTGHRKQGKRTTAISCGHNNSSVGPDLSGDGALNSGRQSQL